MYEISCAVKDVDGSHEIGVLADHISYEQVIELLLDLPETWRKDQVALIIRNEQSSVTEMIAFVSINDETTAVAVYNHNNEFVILNNGDVSINFQKCIAYELLSATMYNRIVEISTDWKFQKSTIDEIRRNNDFMSLSSRDKLDKLVHFAVEIYKSKISFLEFIYLFWVSSYTNNGFDILRKEFFG